MKKRGLLVIIGILLCALSGLIACSRETLPSPQNIVLRELSNKKIVTWDQVPYSTDGYMIEHDNKTYKLETHEYDVTNFDTGVYTFRVKALTKDKNYYTNSPWSSPVNISIRKESGISYRLINDNTEYEVSGIGVAKGDITIFDSFKGLPITSIGNEAFKNRNDITGVKVVGNNLKSIGVSAFSSCARLKFVELPEGLISIGASAFAGCATLSSITIPQSVTTLGDRAFSQCLVLQSITIPDNITELPSSLFSSCVMLSEVNIGKNVKTFNNYVFSGCTSLKKLVVPDSVMNLGGKTFNGSALEEIELGNGLTYISNSAFSGAKKLEKINIPQSVTRIEKFAFGDTALLNNCQDEVLYIDNWLIAAIDETIERHEVTEGTIGIADFAFEKFVDLAEVTIPESVKYVGRSAFVGTKYWTDPSLPFYVYVDNWLVGTHQADDKGTSATEIYTIPDNIVGIADYALTSHETLLSFKASPTSNLKYIGSNAFEFCTRMDSVDIPDTVEYLGTYAFKACYQITRVEIPVGIEKLEGTFFTCYRLVSVIIPTTVTEIGEYTFYSCSALNRIATSASNLIANNIIIHEGVETIDAYAFYAVSPDSGVEIILPESLTTMGSYSFSFCQTLVSITIPQGVTALPDFAFLGCGALKDIEFLGEVTSIGKQAFAHCVNLIEFIVPDTVVRLGDGVFSNSSNIRFVTLSEGLTELPRELFAECHFLDEITIPESVTKISIYAFSNCRRLKTVNLPSGIIQVASYAFYGCNSLESITLGKSIIGIGAHAFYGCRDITIYVDDYIRPSSWSVHWNSGKAQIVWNSVLAKNEYYVVSVKIPLLGEDDVPLDAGCNVPTRSGYSFVGWTLTQGSTISDYDSISDVEAGYTVYAIWEENVE